MSSASLTPMLRSRVATLSTMLALSLSLGACDYIDSFSRPKQTPEEAKAEGIALGAGCRQAGQSLEECYRRHPDSLKAGIFTGWKDMHEYMETKNIQTVAPPPTEPEKTEADKDATKKNERTLRREKREREKEAKSKESVSAHKNRDDSSGKK